MIIFSVRFVRVIEFGGGVLLVVIVDGVVISGVWDFVRVLGCLSGFCEC